MIIDNQKKLLYDSGFFLCKDGWRRSWWRRILWRLGWIKKKGEK